MKKMTKFRLNALLCTSMAISQLSAVVSLGTAFGGNVQDAVLDRVTGNLYVGLAAGQGDSAVSKLARYTSDGTSLSSTDLAGADAEITNLGISNMAVANKAGVPRIAFVTSGETAKITALSDTNGTIVVGQMAADVQHGGAGDGKIHGNLAMSSYLVFAAVGTAANTWLDANSLLAAHLITDGTMVPAAAASSVATLLTAANGTYAITTDLVDADASETPVLHWDEHLERLYVGTTVQVSATPGAGDGARSLAVFSVTPTTGASLALQNLKTNPDSDWGTGAAAATQTIIGIGGAALANRYPALTADAAGSRLNVYAMTTLLTDAGHSYLIISASHAARDTEAKGQVYALPLVTKGYSSQGSLADVNSIDFSVAADAFTSLYHPNSTQAIVGTGNLPIAATGNAVVRLYTVGNTVYANVNIAEDANNESGLHYSQPIFDNNGKIKEWTRWEKAAPSTLGTSATDANLFRSAVDAVTGKVWGVPGGALTQIRSTSWTQSTTTNELAQAVNAQLTNGCYAIHSIGKGTNNFGNVSEASVVAFGGIGKVCFAKVGARTAGYSGATTVQTSQALASYAAGNNFATTTLPNANEKVNTLSYVRGLTGTATGYFVAGTDSGLYIFTTAGDAGGDPNTEIDDLDADYFAATSVWKELSGTAGTAGITKVTGAVRKILSRGDANGANNFFYVLASDVGTDSDIRDTLYRVEIEATSAAMKIEIVAQSGVDGTNSKLANAGRFLDFVIVQGGTGTAGEEIILVTQAGLFQSRVVADAKGAAGAAVDTAEEMFWAEVGAKPNNSYTGNYPFAFAYAPQTAANLTSFETIKYANNSDPRLEIFNYRALDRWGSNGDTLNETVAAEDGVMVRNISPAQTNTSSTSSFFRLNRILTYWSDGGRRLFVTKPADGSDTQSLIALPYHVNSAEWNLTDPVSAISNTVVNTATEFNCIELLPNGMITAGIQNGIIIME